MSKEFQWSFRARVRAGERRCAYLAMLALVGGHGPLGCSKHSASEADASGPAASISRASAPQGSSLLSAAGPRSDDAGAEHGSGRAAAPPKGANLESLREGSNIYYGKLGAKIPIRMRLERKGESLVGVYRYQKSKDNLKLAGTLAEATGVFELDERNSAGAVTGHFRGKVDQSIRGTWSSADEKRSLSFTLEAVDVNARMFTDYPEPVAFEKGVRIVPQESSRSISPFCSSQLTYPTLEGSSDAAKARFNVAFRDWIGTSSAKPSECTDASADQPYYEESGYTLGARRGRWVAIRAGIALREGGDPYGRPATVWSRGGCRVASTETGEVVDLASRLTASGRQRLHDRCIAGYLEQFDGAQDSDERCEGSCKGMAKEISRALKMTDVCLDDGALRIFWDARPEDARMANQVMYEFTCDVPSAVASEYFEPGPPASDFLPSEP